MSAFLCSDRHTWVAALLVIGHQTRLGTRFADRAQISDVRDMAVQLRALNNAAMNSRYKESGQPLRGGPAAFDAAHEWLESHNSADCYQAMRCLRYQCAEGDFRTRPAWEALDAACEALGVAAAGVSSPVWSI